MSNNTCFDESIGRLDMILPDETSYGPRDGSRLGSGGDWLFELWLSRNLVVNRSQYGAVLHCSSSHWVDRGAQIYLLEHNGGTLHHPITLELVKPDSVRLMNRLKVETALKKICRPLRGYKLRAGLYEHFFVHVDEHVKDLSDTHPNTASASLTFENMTIYPSQVPPSELLERLNSRLLWPLTPDVDPILDDWQRRCTRSTRKPSCESVDEVLPIVSQFFGFPLNRLPEHNGICPLDGYITTIEAELRSPGWTWSALVGRHFRFYLCPHCLRIIKSKLVSMS